MPKKEIEKGSQVSRCVRYSAFGAIVAMAACLVIIALGSFGVSHGWIAENNMKHFTIFACAFGCFIGGIFSSTKLKANTLLAGIFVSAIVFAVKLLLGLLIYPEISIEEGGLALLLADLIGGALAGILCGKKKKKKRK